MRDSQEQIKQVHSIFSQVVPVYDLINRILSLREDVRWRRFVARSLKTGETNRVLDVACGTGDLALEVAKHPSSPKVVGLDLVSAMLKPAQKKIAQKNVSIPLINGDGTQLPFPDKSFDAVTIAFGIRNIPNRIAAMKEMQRVLVPGGRVYILEFATPQNHLVKGLYNIYLNRLLPKIAGLISNNPEGYQYLAETIMEFPLPPDFRQEMAEAGLVGARSYSLTHGITWLHIGERSIKHGDSVFGDRRGMGAARA